MAAEDACEQASNGCSGRGAVSRGVSLEPWLWEPCPLPALWGIYPQILMVQGEGKVERGVDLPSHIAATPSPLPRPPQPRCALAAALQSELPPTLPSPLPGARAEVAAAARGRLIQLTNSRQDRCAILRCLPLGGDEAHGRGGAEGAWRGRDSDVTARWLTSGAPGQVSCRDLEGPGSLCSEPASVSYTSLGLRASGDL